MGARRRIGIGKCRIAAAILFLEPPSPARSNVGGVDHLHLELHGNDVYPSDSFQVSGEIQGGSEAPEGVDHGSAELQKPAVDPSDALLGILADKLDDLERVRIANENRLRSLRQVKQLAGTDAEAELSALTEVLMALEVQATKSLEKAMRKHPLGPWVKSRVGLGDKQVARLLAAIGDPLWKPLRDEEGELLGWEPRTIAELRSYCGLGNAAAQKRRKGEQANWSNTAKMRAILCAMSCIKWTGETANNSANSPARSQSRTALSPSNSSRRAQGETASGRANSIIPPQSRPVSSEAAAPRARPRSPYRDVYDAAKETWAERDTSDGHKHMHALRVTAKAILKDIWIETERVRAITKTNSMGRSPSTRDRRQ